MPTEPNPFQALSENIETTFSFYKQQMIHSNKITFVKGYETRTEETLMKISEYKKNFFIFDHITKIIARVRCSLIITPAEITWLNDPANNPQELQQIFFTVNNFINSLENNKFITRKERPLKIDAVILLNEIEIERLAITQKSDIKDNVKAAVNDKTQQIKKIIKNIHDNQNITYAEKDQLTEKSDNADVKVPLKNIYQSANDFLVRHKNNIAVITTRQSSLSNFLNGFFSWKTQPGQVKKKDDHPEKTVHLGWKK